MPRRTPGAIRAARTRRHARVHVLIDLYRAMLRQPGRYLHLYRYDPVWKDVADIRDELEQELNTLSPKRRRRIRELVEPSDDEFRRRTLPNPDSAAAGDWPAGAWWRHRLREL